jgi:aryl-alcohol dehydrogenase-like predicted oxidoreductase
MNYRKFGKTDLQLSEIGFGAWAIGGNAKVGTMPIGWGPADDDASEKAIHAAIEAGINFFDTADFYGLGHSEELLGKTLKNNADIFIATKVGHKSVNDQIVLDYSKEYILQACDASLRRLQRSVIDYYQLHSARLSHLQAGECIEAMEILKQRGKIRYWGLSLNTFYPEPEAKFLMEKSIGDGLQLVFNIINQRALPVIKEASAKGYGIIARMPLQFGLLTGKFTASTTFTAEDHRSFRLTPSILTKSLQILDTKISPLAAKNKIDLSSLALSFILSIPEISTVIPGIRTQVHVQQNTSGLRKLAENDINFLLSLGDHDWKPVMEMMEKQG